MPLYSLLMLKPNRTYRVLRQFTVAYTQGDIVEEALQPGTVVSVDEAGRCSVGSRDAVLPPLVHSRTDWFAAPADAFNPEVPAVAWRDFLRGLVKAHQDNNAEELFWWAGRANATGKALEYHAFTGALANHPDVRKFKDGVEVLGTTKDRGHVKGMTYSMR